MSIVMGLDQHRAQITADWLDTETGEVKRARISPADRAGMRAFVERFRGQRLEVALEATTGWRFVIEELRAIGAVAHLAEPAETAGLRGPKKRAKGEDPARYGLDKPVGEITLYRGDGTAIVTLMVGKKDGQRLYVQTKSAPTIYAVEAGQLELPKIPEDFQG